MGYIITAATAAIYWFVIRRLTGDATWHRYVVLGWNLTAAPVGLGAWVAYDLTGFSPWLFAVAYLVGVLIFVGWIKVSKVLGLDRRKGSSQVLRGREVITEENAIKWLPGG
jgi:hypothetical protein